MPRTAIVTGAAGGIGRAVATRLGTDGFQVVVGYTGHEDKATQTADEIKAVGGNAITVRSDVRNENEVAHLFERATAAFGQLDAVVHSAGIMSLSPMVKNDVEQFDRTIATNLRGTFLVLARAAQQVADGGRIITLSSSIIAKSTPGYGAYIASKAGVEGLIRVLAQELRGRNISVNAVAPGPVATALFLEGKTAEQIAQLSKMAPMERLGEPVDVAGVVSFLVGPDGGWINAQVVRANGGFA